MADESEIKTSNGHAEAKTSLEDHNELQNVSLTTSETNNTEGREKGDAVANVSEAEGQVKKLPYPKSVFFIISNEFCERFNYYGLRTLLVLYLSRELDYSDDAATIIFHIFTMFVYFLCIVGAIISDSWLGKFKTILILSLVYVCGSVMVTLGAMPPLNLPATTFTMIGLALIALGSGGIKPCVSAFGGDQFKLPEQLKQMTTFFSLFYFSINAGSLISTTVTPILREDVRCFGGKECYSLGFGVPAVLMVVSIVIFVLGRPLYKSKPPAGNMVVLVSKTIGNAIATKWRSKEKRDHWLDYADQKYDKGLIEDVKVLIRVLVLYLPLPVFWALFDQQGSRWTFQATRMDGDMGSWDIKPDQLQMLNPLLILLFIPLYDVAFYPALSWIGIRRPLQKLTMGGILAGVAFIISAVVELKLETTYPTLPGEGVAQLRIFNGEVCGYKVVTNIPGHNNFIVDALEEYVNKEVPITEGGFELKYSMEPTKLGFFCPRFSNGSHLMQGKRAYSLYLNSMNSEKPLDSYEDFVSKPPRGSPLVRTLVNLPSDYNVVWLDAKTDRVVHQEGSQTHNLNEFSAGSYKLLIGHKEMYQLYLRTGGVYTLLINRAENGTFNTKLVVVTEPNSVNVLWLVPQYVVMTLGEVMFSVTGLEFSYSQAPSSMKSVLQACWLLTVAFGNVIVVIIAELKLFESQASEFFLFAGLMFADMLIFMVVAYLYKPNVPKGDSEVEPLSINEATDEESKPAPQGFDNKAQEIDE